MGETPTLHLLSRDEILAAQDLQQETVEVPEWGGSVIVRGLTGTQRDAFEMSNLITKIGKGGRTTSEVNLSNMRAKLIARTVVDGAGNLVFSEADILALGQKSGAALDRVFTVASQLSGISQRDVEELTEGLKDDQSDGSGSDSLSPSIVQ